ncbi:MAG: M15 family metallopeptidase [Nocardioides sp.]
MTATVLAALLLAGCGAATGRDAVAEPDPTRPTVAGSTAPSGEGVALDPALAVDPPGRLEDRLLPADLLIFSQAALGADTVRKIRGLDGVVAVEEMGLAQVTIENRAINVAAVDPGTYRRYTPVGSAQLQEVWDRVAGGEIAIDAGLGRKLADKTGFVTMGVSADAPEIHVGALADQIPQVDAVVNRKWGEELQMTFGNALLVSTGIASPQSVRPAITRIAGTEASVQILGPDLDTSVQQTAFLTGGSVAAVVGTFNYTVLGGGRIAPEQSWVSSHIATEPVPILGSMTCNRAMFPQLQAALSEIVDRGLAEAINPGEYAGCYYPRFIAGTQTLSNHSFGLAFDINVPGNQRGTVGEIDRTVVSIFKRWGFAWGGDWGYTDPMHFEMNAVVEVR